MNRSDFNATVIDTVRSPLLAQPKGSEEVAIDQSGSILQTPTQCTAKPIELRPQQRLPNEPARREMLIAVKLGVLAIDASPTKTERQVLDFLLPGDLVSFAEIPTQAASVRAITVARLAYLDPALQNLPGGSTKSSCLVIEQLQAQIKRANIHKLIIGYLGTEARVASFLMMWAMRCVAACDDAVLALPMSRDDIANYLAMNCDTLSRIMMRFETSMIIKRLNRHSVRVLKNEALCRLTPIATLITEGLSARSQLTC